MIPRLAVLCSFLLLAAPAVAQPLPQASPLAAEASSEPVAPEPVAGPQPEGAHVFCDQSVTFALAPRARVPASYRGFLGVWSDAAWAPNSCAALVVENIDRAGRAQILYVYGPLSASDRPGPGGVLRGTGIIRDGVLRFQNSDGTQFVFRPDIADLAGRMTTPRGDSFAAIFKRSF